MIAFHLERMPAAIDTETIQFRRQQSGDLTVAFVRAQRGTDLRPAIKGLPGDLCQCPHWGYVLKGKVRMHTPGGHQDYQQGQAFYWAPGHAPEMLEDTEYVDFSPTDDPRRGDPPRYRPALVRHYVVVAELSFNCSVHGDVDAEALLSSRWVRGRRKYHSAPGRGGPASF